MKKIILSCSVLIVLSILVVSFAGCGGNKGDETTTTTAQSGDSDVVVNGFSAEIGSDGVVIKKDGNEFQTVKYPVNNDFNVDVAYAKEHYEFKDMNFDGVPDFYIAASKNGETINFLCWIYNETSGKFEYNSILSSLKNISVDSDAQAIYCVVTFEGTQKVVCYRWVDGHLRINNQYDITDDTLPADVTNAVNNNQLVDNNKKPSTTSKVEKTTASSNKKPTADNNQNKEPTTEKKPANITTTAPAKDDGVILATGDIDDGWY